MGNLGYSGLRETLFHKEKEPKQLKTKSKKTKTKQVTSSFSLQSIALYTLGDESCVSDETSQYLSKVTLSKFLQCLTPTDRILKGSVLQTLETTSCLF